ncbi:PorP/SprF family type IX secretion system membrane protein [Pontibacter ruber]|uniref:PorP/SprF family type IX secretion system membrane protein n=1 Tax=Pontibacter ruber TaxID=1343895 RepID=A0ABW5CYS2_9BACT|nr:PorP/SprF family type IX secretion system membrane protein [Pontibacter ruber]
MSVKKAFLCFLFFLGTATAMAQDAFFTQQYANRLYLNPAFTGLNHEWSVAAAHRGQWPALNGSFITNQLTADYRFTGSKSAVGLLLQQDRAGIGGLQKLQAGAQYAYQTRLTDQWAFSAGLQGSIASLRVNYDNLVFGDQLSDNGVVAVTSAEANTFEPTSYISFTAGGLVYSEQFWFGLTAAHLNRPSYGFAQKTELPLRFTANAGYKLYARTSQSQGKFFEFSVTPAITYTHQKNLSRTDLGLYTIYTPVSLGLIYKGVPVSGGTDQDQVLALLAGIQIEQLKIGFSHDVGLQGISRQAGGANEVSLVFEQIDLNHLFGNRFKDKIIQNIVCPAF